MTFDNLLMCHMYHHCKIVCILTVKFKINSAIETNLEFIKKTNLHEKKEITINLQYPFVFMVINKIKNKIRLQLW